MPSVTQARVTNVPDPRPHLHEIAGSRFRARAHQPVEIHNGLLWEISYSHLTAERVCTSVGSRKFGRRSNSPSSRFEVAPVDVTWRCSVGCVFRPAPRDQRRRIELEPARRRVEPRTRDAVHDDAGGGAVS